MRESIAILMLIYVISSCSNSKKWNQSTQEDQEILSPYQRLVSHYQDSMNLSFITGENQVLLHEDLELGKHLDFFAINEEYKCEASFEKVESGKVFEMKTSTDRLPLYKDFGILHFALGKDSFSLHLYQNQEYPDYLFCPFKDQTNGVSSYGAGRYLDFAMSDTMAPIIDFNLCYNPLCAYNYKYSCPIPPKENHLNIAIEAGVKNWVH